MRAMWTLPLLLPLPKRILLHHKWGNSPEALDRSGGGFGTGPGFKQYDGLSTSPASPFSTVFNKQRTCQNTAKNTLGICSPSSISGWSGWVPDLQSRWRARNLFFPGLSLSWLKTDVPRCRSDAYNGNTMVHCLGNRAYPAEPKGEPGLKELNQATFSPRAENLAVPLAGEIGKGAVTSHFQVCRKAFF